MSIICYKRNDAACKQNLKVQSRKRIRKHLQSYNAAFRDASFLLRTAHQEQVAKILSDPRQVKNDKFVALTFLRNSEVSCQGQFPTRQDTGTAIITGKKGQNVWTDGCDEEALSLGAYKTHTEENLRYSQNVPLDMYKEINTGCNLPCTN